MTLAAAGEWLRRRPLQRAIAAIGPNYLPPALTAAGVASAFGSLYAPYGLSGLPPPLAAFLLLARVAFTAFPPSLPTRPFLSVRAPPGRSGTPRVVGRPAPAATPRRRRRLGLRQPLRRLRPLRPAAAAGGVSTARPGGLHRLRAGPAARPVPCGAGAAGRLRDAAVGGEPGALGLGSLCLPSCALGRCAGGDPRGRRLVARLGHAAGRGALAAAVVRCALVAWGHTGARRLPRAADADRKSTRLNSSH